MPLMPKRVKHRKMQRGSRAGTATRNTRIAFGEFALQTLERAWITNTQIEAARVALTRNMKRKGKLWIRIFPDKSVTARPPETRMGKGKGQPENGSPWCVPATSCSRWTASRSPWRVSPCVSRRQAAVAHEVPDPPSRRATAKGERTRRRAITSPRLPRRPNRYPETSQYHEDQGNPRAEQR